MKNLLAYFNRHERTAFQFSGGKDSTALLLEMKPWWDRMTVYHLDTGDMHPELVDLVATIARQLPHFAHVQSDVFAVRAQFGLPTDVLPWTSAASAHACNTGKTLLLQDRVSCCFRTIMLPLAERMRDDSITLIIRGQKDGDKMKGALKTGDVVDGIEYLYPFENYTDEMCFALLRSHEVAIPSFYLEAAPHAGDCVSCTAWCEDTGRVAHLRRRFPEEFVAYRQNMLQIAGAVSNSTADVFRVTTECLEGE